MLEIIQLPALVDNYIYLLHEPISGDTAVVDPAVAEPVNILLDQKQWRLKYILNTHHHADHVGGNITLKQQTGCQIIASSADRRRIPGIDIEVNEGDSIHLGSQTFYVVSTPGHTLGHIVYFCPDSELLFCGDTLFSLGCGRLFEGSAEQMWLSLKKLKALPSNTKMYCAHEYTLANGRFAQTLEPENPRLLQRIQEVERLRESNQSSLPSTIGQELATNPFFREESADLRKHIGMTESNTPLEVFALIREMKDHFS